MLRGSRPNEGWEQTCVWTHYTYTHLLLIFPFLVLEGIHVSEKDRGLAHILRQGFSQKLSSPVGWATYPGSAFLCLSSSEVADFYVGARDLNSLRSPCMGNSHVSHRAMFPTPPISLDEKDYLVDFQDFPHTRSGKSCRM